MTLSTIRNQLLAIASLTLLTACGGGVGVFGDIGGGGDGYADITPIDGVSNYDAVEQNLGMTVDGNREVATADFDFVTRGDEDRPFTRGDIEFSSGKATKENADTDRKFPAHGVFTRYFGENSREFEGDSLAYHQANNSRVNVDEVNVGGQSMIYARTINDDRENTTESAPDGILYIPSNAEGRSHVAMHMQSANGVNTRAGIFGRRTTSEEVSRQTGDALFSGVTHAGTYNRPDDLADGHYAGSDVQAQVSFRDRGITFTTNAQLERIGGPGADMRYTISGDVDQNGRLHASDITLDGQPAADTHFDGALYGPNADGMGYVYRMHSSTNKSYGGWPEVIQGGAILNRTN